MESVKVSIKGAIPDSVVPYPGGVVNKAKYFFWKAYTPIHVWGMNLLLRLHILHHEGRQNFLLGKLAPGVKLEDFLVHMHAQGWGNHFVAWHDDGQVMSIRKLVNFTWQYHLRIFSDGEVRGHYEYTPESHPRRHVKEVGMEARREDFLNFLGDWVIPAGTVPRRPVVLPSRARTIAARTKRTPGKSRS